MCSSREFNSNGKVCNKAAQAFTGRRVALLPYILYSCLRCACHQDVWWPSTPPKNHHRRFWLNVFNLPVTSMQLISSKPCNKFTLVSKLILVGWDHRHYKRWTQLLGLKFKLMQKHLNRDSFYWSARNHCTRKTGEMALSSLSLWPH